MRWSALLVFAALPALLPAGWYTDCLSCEAHLGGNSKIGPFDTKSECDSARQVNLDAHYPYRECYEEGGGSSAGGGSDSSLQDATSRALAQGLVNGDSQTFGVGLMGLGAMALMSGGSSQPSAADLAQQRQAELNRQAQVRAAEAAAAERKRRFEADKQETLSDLKGQDAALDPKAFGLDGEDDLKDAVASKKTNKNWKIRLKPAPNPLKKPEKTGDSVGVTALFDTWEEASACDGLSARTGSGRIACCQEGYPYFCNGKCYKEAALDDMRIPCASALMTSRQGDRGK